MHKSHVLTQQERSDIQTEVETCDQMMPGEPETSADLTQSAQRLGFVMPKDNVLVISGACTQSFPIAGRTVREVRSQLQDAMNIGPNAAALVNGTKVPARHPLEKNDVLEFVKIGGEKGRSRRRND